MADAEPELRTYHLSCEVDPHRGGWTLSRFLMHRFRRQSADRWEARLAAGVVSVNGAPAAAETVVEKGDIVEYTVLHAEPPVDFGYEVLHDDDHVLAVSKSGNLPVHGGGKFIHNTLIAKLGEDRTERLRLAHRLDRETSGIVLLAKSRQVAAELERQFRERRVQKLYLCVVRGHPSADELVVDAPIARREPSEPPYFRVVSADRGKPSVTRFSMVRTGRSRARQEIALVEARPESGRTNQIRVHAAHAGFPILGDKVYGVAESVAKEFVRTGPTAEIDAAAGAARHLLHCAGLTVEHPGTGRLLELVSEPPPDFAAIWALGTRSSKDGHRGDRLDPSPTRSR